MEQVIHALTQNFPELALRRNEPLSRHCSFRIGGSCAALLSPRTVDEMCAVMQTLREMDVEPLIIGNGTNLLVTDEALERIVIKTDALTEIVRDGETGLTALCGVSLARLAATAADFGLAGLEFAHGIPGTLGGAIVMNAGAYGGEMKDVVAETEYLDENGTRQRIRGAQHGFSYRHSVFSDGSGLVLRCRLALSPDRREDIRERMAELAARRRASQPLDKPSAGSTFKRPAAGYAAAMIDQSGLRGYQVGGAAVSEKHAGFVVNLGGASFSDVLAVMEHVQNEVYKRFNVELEPEIRIIR